MFFTFNDLSAQNNSFQTEADAKSEIEQFVDFCKLLSSISAVDEMVFPETMVSMPLFRDYTIGKWFFDATVPKNKRQFIMRFFDKYRRYYSKKDIEGECCITIDGQHCVALGCTFALEHNHTALSWSTNSEWIKTTICGKYTFLDEYGEILTDDCCIENVWTNMKLEQITEIQRQEISSSISSGQDLWEKRQKLYPSLVFCENVKDQLFDDSEKYHIVAVMKKLDRFQEYFSCCSDTYNPDELGMGARTESETVKSTPALSKFRKFRLPNGNEEHFFDHVGFNGKYSGGRIYFLPDNCNKRCFIGYIGRHLPTKNF